MDYVFSPAPQASVAVAGTAARFPVRRIWCIGRNYADHAREMGHDPSREPPFFFQKPADAVVASGSVLNFPVQTSNLHHEIELAVCLGRGGRDIPVEHALDQVFGYALALDMTRRDLQSIAKKAQRPWEMGKSFDESCPISAVHPVAEIGHPQAGAITLSVNGEVRQSGNLDQMIWGVDEAIAHLSSYVALAPGDLILTGTPAGVGPCHAGDVLHGHCAGVDNLEVTYRT